MASPQIYKSRSSIDKAAKKLETMKTESSAKKSKAKKMDRIETSLKESSRNLSLFEFKSSAIVTLVLFVTFGLLNSLFLGFSPPRSARSGLFPMPDPKTN